jgi:beta-glucosidase
VLRVDGAVVVDNTAPERGTGFYGAGSTLASGSFEFDAGHPYEVVVDLWPRSASSPILGARIAAERPVVGDEFERAVRAAAAAEVAVVVVGSNGAWESEGFDRPDLSLPGRQRELIEAVTAANPRTVVVVNAGSPVDMPWATSAGAVLMTWYPGEEGADALADMLVGLAEPSGRLPITFPVAVEDGPAHQGSGERYPGVYGEGVYVGYRHYTTAGIAPRFAFGHGLSYGSFEFGHVWASPGGVSIDLVNTGPRRGTEVVQAYVRAVESRVVRPDRALAAFVKVTLDPGEHRTVELELTAASLRYWDTGTHGWRTDPGPYELLVGGSSVDIWATVTAEVALS